MKDQTVFDLGPTLATLDVEQASVRNNLNLITAFVNGISLRSGNLNLPSIRDRFLNCIWLMAGVAENEHVTQQMRAWIDEKASQTAEP